MKRLSEVIPDPETVGSLAPEELAGVLMEVLNSMSSEEERAYLNPTILCLERAPEGYPAQVRDSISKTVMEAWVWLEREGLVAARPGDLTHGYYFITRRGRGLKNATDLSAYRHSNLLPKEFLHPIIASKVWSAFIRGEYQTAVFQAFKEVEVAVRSAASLAATDIGVELMRKAFHKDTGPLTNPALPPAEREGMAHLFAGAIGLLKNPYSHRDVVLEDPKDAAAIITFASLLMNIVDRARP